MHAALGEELAGRVENCLLGAASRASGRCAAAFGACLLTNVGHQNET
jgi:hypothetical protein